MGASTQAMQQDLDEVALGSSAQAVEHVDEVKAPITLYYVVITAKPKRDGARLERASRFSHWRKSRDDRNRPPDSTRCSGPGGAGNAQPLRQVACHVSVQPGA